MYPEGFAAAADLPYGYEHAWSVSTAGEIVDPHRVPGQQVVYLGLVVAARFRRTVAERSLLDPHPAGLALLRDGLPDEARGRVPGGSPVSMFGELLNQQTVF